MNEFIHSTKTRDGVTCINLAHVRKITFDKANITIVFEYEEDVYVLWRYGCEVDYKAERKAILDNMHSVTYESEREFD